jgi:hypothetical protein
MTILMIRHSAGGCAVSVIPRERATEESLVSQKRFLAGARNDDTADA